MVQAVPEIPDLTQVAIDWAKCMYESVENQPVPDFLNFSVNWGGVKFVFEPTNYELSPVVQSHPESLFAAKYINTTDGIQWASIQTEKVTKSTAFVTFERGFSRAGGAIQMTLPDELRYSAGFGHWLNIENVMGETVEKDQIWSMDDKVSVNPRTKISAEMLVVQTEWEANFYQCAQFGGRVVVTATDLTDDGNEVVRYGSPIADIISYFKYKQAGVFDNFHIAGDTVTVDMSGRCEFKYGARQELKMQINDLEKE